MIRPKNTRRSSSQVNLLFLGRLAHDTGFETCLELYSTLKKKGKIKLTVAGDGPLHSRIPAEAHHLGFISNPARLIEESDWVFASGYLTILESMLKKRLVIASFNNPVRKDYLMMHPLSSSMILGESSAQIADKLKWHSSEQTAKMIEEAYSWAQKQTWGRLATLYEELWQGR